MIAQRLTALGLLSIGGRAFQVAPPLRVAPSRVLIPRPPSTTIALQMPASRASSLRPNELLLQSDDELEAETLPVELVKDDAHDGNALAKLASRLRDIAQTQPGSLLLSLAIFLLPLFMISAFPESAWAAGSGGRMGGSFGGSARSSSSRSYSAPAGSYSSGYSRGYSSGYYSRPNVIVSPGISPVLQPVLFSLLALLRPSLWRGRVHRPLPSADSFSSRDSSFLQPWCCPTLATASAIPSAVPWRATASSVPECPWPRSAWPWRCPTGTTPTRF